MLLWLKEEATQSNVALAVKQHFVLLTKEIKAATSAWFIKGFSYDISGQFSF